MHSNQMVKNGLATVLFGMILVASMTGCRSTQDPTEQQTRWYELNTKFAQNLESRVGSMRWHILPIQGVAYPIGKVISGQAPITDCEFGPPKSDPFAAMPAIYASRGVDAFVGVPLPDDWATNMKAEASFKSEDKMSVEYSALRAEYVNND